jgi:DNA polymerase-3 subunit alpha (Gram-positive type)
MFSGQVLFLRWLKKQLMVCEKLLEERSIRYNQTELNRLVQGCAGVKRTTGQHPGGLMVLPKECDVFDFTPLQRPANDTGSPI